MVKRERSTAAIDNHVGSRIRERRIMLGLTQQQLADRLCHDNLSEAQSCGKQHRRLRGRRSVPPLIHGFSSEEMKSASGDQVALNIECVVDGGVAGEETLG
jgi:hypothetical protein